MPHDGPIGPNTIETLSHRRPPSVPPGRWGCAAPVLAFSALLSLVVAACGEEGSATMKPGEKCLSCHRSGGEAEDEIFSAAGTIYSPDGTGARGVTVRLTDSKAQTRTATTNEVGNFFFRDALTPPFTVVLTSGDVSVSMPTPAGNGDCNSCHQAGRDPGRILFPGPGGGGSGEPDGGFGSEDGGPKGGGEGRDGGAAGPQDAGTGPTDGGSVQQDSGTGQPDAGPSCIPAAMPGPRGMNPGRDCTMCHHDFTIAGTLYSDAAGSAPVGGATVRVTDANGQVMDLATASNGNFFTSRALTFPVSVTIGKCPDTVTMRMPAPGGGCNGCHGPNNRVHLP